MRESKQAEGRTVVCSYGRLNRPSHPPRNNDSFESFLFFPLFGV